MSAARGGLILTPTCVFENKATSDLTLEHELELVVYHYMWETRRDFGHACAI